MWLLTVLRLIPSVRAMRRVPKPSSYNRSRADTAPGSSIASLRSPSNCEGDDLSRSSPIKNPRGKLPTAGQFLLSPGGSILHIARHQAAALSSRVNTPLGDCGANSGADRQGKRIGTEEPKGASEKGRDRCCRLGRT